MPIISKPLPWWAASARAWVPVPQTIDVTDAQRKADLLELLRRGLNCWEAPPPWLLQLYDELNQEKYPCSNVRK